MNGGLRELWGLPDVSQTQKSTQAEGFGRAFREGMSELNKMLQSVAAHAPPAEFQPLNAQRSQLYEAFQQVSAQIDPANPAKADAVVKRVLAAVSILTAKAAALSAGDTVGRDDWLKREADFDDALLKIGELEDSQHPKAPAFRKLGDAIRVRVSDRQFDQANAALEQLQPKLGQYHAEHVSSGIDGTNGVAGQPAPVGPASNQPTAPVSQTDRQASCLITVTNSSGVVLTLLDQGHERGDFMKSPNKTVQPGASTEFVSVETQGSAEQGCKGFAVWEVGASGECTWRIEWDNPEQDKNTTVSTLSGNGAKNYRELDQIGQGDENVPTAFTITGVGLPNAAPPPATGAGTATLEVLVLGLSRAPREGATVKISAGPTSPPDGVTDASGKVRFDLLPGDYNVNAALKIATWEVAHVKQASLEPGKTFTVTVEKMNHGQLIVSVTRDGKPEPGAKVTVDSSKQDPRPTGNDGQTGFTLPIGTHKVSAESADGAWTSTTQGKVNAGEFSGAEIKLVNTGAGSGAGGGAKPSTETGRVTVVVTDMATDAPIGDAQVTFAGGSPTSINAATGGYVFAAAPVGDQDLGIASPNHRHYNGTVSVKKGENTTYNAFLEAKKPAPATGAGNGNEKATVGGGAGAGNEAANDRARLAAELSALEQDLQRLIAEHQLAV